MIERNVKRLLFFGAHPDDCDLLCGGTAIQWAAAGHRVKFVSVTSGDTGHQTLSRKETAAVRAKEAAASGKTAGIEYEVLDHPCGLEASVAIRYELLRIIRKFGPDVVISHRLYDYHPDHRATAQLVMDTAYIVMVPHYCEDTPVPEINPIYAYCRDRFVDPRPFRPDAAVAIDSVVEKKLDMLNCHASQFYEWLPWIEGFKDFDAGKMTETQRREWLKRWLERCRISESGPDREALIGAYGESGKSAVFAETFEQSPYSRHLPLDEFRTFMLP